MTHSLRFRTAFTRDVLMSRTTLRKFLGQLFLLFCSLGASTAALSLESEGPDDGLYPVGTTHMRITGDFSGLSKDQIHTQLSGYVSENGKAGFVTDKLEHPQDAWVINVEVPDHQHIYGKIAGTSLPVLVYLNYPSTNDNDRDHYRFPFYEAEDTVLHHMQGPGEKPIFADTHARYPLVLISHGRAVHGIWEVGHARRLASHGYITITVNYGDLRINDPSNWKLDTLFRPLAGKAVLDHVLASEDFGSNIDHSRIATSGHSLGGFTSLALAGGRYLDENNSVHDPRVSAVVAAAPWVGGRHGGHDYDLFGAGNTGLAAIEAPVLTVFGSRDKSTSETSILGGMEHLSGPRYIIELIDQPHIFQAGSWQDLANWELLFLAAFLKKDAKSLRQLQTSTSMKGGNEDIQHFDLQRPPVNAERPNPASATEPIP
jgi:dienelactone hydrolase